MQEPRRSRGQRYDAVVVGAGLIGLACAWRAQRRGMSVLVVDRASEPGAAASSVAAGMLAPVTEADFGELGPLRVNLAGRERWSAFAAELEELTGMPTGYRESGALVVAADADDAGELRRLHEFQRELGLDAEWLTPSRCRELEPGLSPRIAGGILAPQDGQAEPRAVTRALAAAVDELALGCRGRVARARGRTRDRRAHERRDDRLRPGRARLRRLERRARAGRARDRRCGRSRARSSSCAPAARWPSRSRACCARRAATSSAAATAASCSARRWRSRASTRRSPPTASSGCSRRPTRCCPTSASSSWSVRAPGCARARRTTRP